MDQDNPLYRTPVRNRLRVLRESSPGTRPSSPALQIPPSPCLKTLGFGTGVNILLFERSSKQGSSLSPWAIKKVRKRNAQGTIGKRLEDEAAILKSLNHPNIIGYRGFKKDPKGTHILAIENGDCSLFDVIQHRYESGKDEPLPSKSILKVMKGTCEALKYLHLEAKRLHGDIKSGNVLVIGGEKVDSVKLCDFGVTLKLDDAGEKVLPGQDYVGTEAWSPREVIDEEDEALTTKVDMFAFGCLIYEMLALRPPHVDKLECDSDEEDDEDTSIDDTEYREALGSRPELPEWLDLGDDYEIILGIFYACTEEDPCKRPTPQKILNILASSKTATK